MLSNFTVLVFSVLSLQADSLPPFYFARDIDFLYKYKQMLVDVREEKITPSEAKHEFSVVLKELRRAFPNNSDEVSNIVFPLIGGNLSAVGGKGSGFYVRAFNLFDQKVSGSHPAHDIFIYDPDKDCIDNRRNEYVDVASVSNGIVIAIEKEWTDSSAYKGGNFVWIYDTERGGLWYYAHHRKVFVEIGQIVIPGDKIGEVGRSGSSAANLRSDTHLHLMYLGVDSDYNPIPINYYPWFKDEDTVFLNRSTTAKKLTREKLNIEKIKPKEIGLINTKFNFQPKFRK